ncbi:MAG TPA: hypothetical protein VFQ91_20860 [Bryobacteraceae bacterium]|nr:hypothetical protein [Bryobacteraceae bacterium]
MDVKTMGLFFAMAGGVMAGQCEDSFTKQGNPLVGTKYNASVTVKNLSVADAVGQLHGIAVQKNLDILSEDAENGSMLLEQPMSFRNKAIPYVVSAAGAGDAVTVQILVKLNKGAMAKADDAKGEICGILSQIQGGDAGKLASQQGAQAASANGPRKVDALKLSLELARQTKDSAESIPLRYKGKSFTVSGRVDYVIKDGKEYRVAFDIPEPGNMLIKPGPLDPTFKIDISCLMAPSQAAWAVALRKGEKLRLTGSYADYDQFKKVMWLENCKPE